MASSKVRGELIKKKRTERGLSQTDLARLMGYKDRTTVAKLEAGETSLPESKVPRMASALGVSEFYLTDYLERNLRALDVDIEYTDDKVVLYEPYKGNTWSYPLEVWEIFKETGDAKPAFEDLEISVHDIMTGSYENKKAPADNGRSLSEDHQYLINRIRSLSDEEVRGLRTIVDQVLALRGK